MLSLASVHRLNLRFQQSFQHLLKTSGPTPAKSFQLRKLLCLEAQERGGDFEQEVNRFFSLPYEKRNTMNFEKVTCLEAYPWLLNQFVLDFRSAAVSEKAAAALSRNLHFYLCSEFRPPAKIFSIELFQVVVHELVHPRYDGKREGLDLADFVSCWDQVVKRQHGDQFDGFFEALQKEISQALALAIPSPMVPISIQTLENTFDPTQTELDWLCTLLLDFREKRSLSPFPHSRGPQHREVRKIENWARTLNYHDQTQGRPGSLQIQVQVIQSAASILKRYGQIRAG